VKSSLETLFAAQLRAAGLFFEREYRFCSWRRWLSDFVVEPDPYTPDHPRPEEGVLVEIQGGGFVNGGHSRGMGLERDCEKLATAAALGWRVIPMTGRQVKNGTGLALVKVALGLEPPETLQAAREAERATARSRKRRKRPARNKAVRGLPERVRRAVGLK